MAQAHEFLRNFCLSNPQNQALLHKHLDLFLTPGVRKFMVTIYGSFIVLSFQSRWGTRSSANTSPSAIIYLLWRISQGFLPFLALENNRVRSSFAFVS